MAACLPSGDRSTWSISGNWPKTWSGRFKLLVPQNVTIGGGYRYKHISWVWIDKEHSQHHAGGYIQDVIELAKPLTLQIGASLELAGLAAPEWIVPDARALYDTAVAEGWDVDGAPGFVYIIDWEGRPVVRERMHWVSAEAIGAAAVLWGRTRIQHYADQYALWWDYVADNHLDPVGGSWWHELGTDNAVSRTVWEGKADIYHAVQATLIPRLPAAPALAAALANGALR